MALRAEQYSELATAYERAAADSLVPAKQSAGFFYRLAAKLAAKKVASGQLSNGKLIQTEPEASAHLQALNLLAIRWRLFQLASEPFPLPTRSPRAARLESAGTSRRSLSWSRPRPAATSSACVMLRSQIDHPEGGLQKEAAPVDSPKAPRRAEFRTKILVAPASTKVPVVAARTRTRL